jgi:N-acetylglucosaminyldiphosphoundecaprenol N-acetyl-beta-D-mannosaminyltransferase
MKVFNKLLTSEDEVLEKIFNGGHQDSSLLVTYFNQHCFNVYSKNDKYQKLIDENFSVYPDGIGIYLSLRFLFDKKIQRTDATQLNHLIIDKLIENKGSVFIIGGKFDESFLVKYLNKKGINLAGYCRGFFSEQEAKDIIQKAGEAKYILIGMGVPGQEYFADEIIKSLPGKTIICVGNLLEFYLGTIKRAPVIFQKLGIEWIFRLLTEPRRLWRRYILGIPEFLYRIIKIKLE